MFCDKTDAFFRVTSAKEAWDLEIKRACDCQPNYRLIFLLHGCTSSFIVNNVLQKIENLTLLYIPKGASWSHEATREKRITICFDAIGLEETEPQVITSHLFTPFFRMAAKLYREKPYGYIHRANAQFHYILELASRLSSHAKQGTPQYQTIQKGVEYLRANFRKPDLRITKLASLCYISERRFRDLYKECYNVSPKQAIIEMRINYACQLLQNEQLPISEVALSSGFSDVKHFSHSFRSVMQCSPTAYRRLFLRPEVQIDK